MASLRLLTGSSSGSDAVFYDEAAGTLRMGDVIYSSHETTWAKIYASAFYFSFISTLLALYQMRRLGGDVLRSTIRFVIGCFLLSSSIHALSGALVYTFLIHDMEWAWCELKRTEGANVDESILELLMEDGRDDGGEAAYVSKLTHGADPLSLTLTALLMVENTFFFLSSYWIVLLTKELFKLAMRTIDRGPENERAKIGRSVIGGAGILFVFLVVCISTLVSHKGYNKAYRMIMMAEMVTIMMSILYATYALLRLRKSGRKEEHIHGLVLDSPLYRRLKRLMVVCLVFTLPYALMQIALLGMNAAQVDDLPDYLVGCVQLLYFLFGAAQSLIMSGSQQCCLNILNPIIPTHVKTSPEWKNMRASRRHDSFAIGFEPATAPEHPVFVNTDIESSSALWAQAPEHVIDAAQRIHDDLLRASLPKFRGYEITTVGDAFELAFHDIHDAVSYCLEVQLQLLNAKWPAGLEDVVPATKTEYTRGLHVKPQPLFKGIRVRMGIHDTDEDEDGTLVMQEHHVTGKMVYIGASDLIAREISDVGFGGQIIVSKRIAQWLHDNGDSVPTPFVLDFYGPVAIEQLELDVLLYEITPKIINGRRKFFRRRRGFEDESNVADEKHSDLAARERAENDRLGLLVDINDSGESTTEESVAYYQGQETPVAASSAAGSPKGDQLIWKQL